MAKKEHALLWTSFLSLWKEWPVISVDQQARMSWALSGAASSSVLAAPKGWLRLSKTLLPHPERNRVGTREMRVDRMNDCQPLPSFSYDPSLLFSARLTSYISSSSFGNEGSGNTSQAWERDKCCRYKSVQPSHHLLHMDRLVSPGSDESAGTYKAWDHNAALKGKQNLQSSETMSIRTKVQEQPWTVPWK